MATLNSTNYALQNVNVPSEKIAKGEQKGAVYNAITRITYSGNVQAVNDKINLFKLPKGARITNFKCYGVSTGTTGILECGIVANGVDAADANAFGVYDFGGQAVNGQMNGTLTAAAVPAGQDLTLGAETIIQANFTEATDAADGDSATFEIEYVIN